MNLLALLELKSKAEKLSLMTEPAEIMKLLEPLGFNDESVVKGVLSAARLVSTDPKQTVAKFVEDGGLARLLSGQKTQPEDAAIECPHCQKVIFLALA